MRFKCNTYNCQDVFELEYSENDLEKKGLPICPKCKNISNKSYRYEN